MEGKYIELRTFLAIELPTPVREGLVKKQDQLKRELPSMNWVRPESLHITVKFLGMTPETIMEGIKKTVSEAMADFSPFSLTLKGFGVFPDVRQPRIFWTGIQGNTQILTNVVGCLESALESLGYPAEGKLFHPHLTLARIKKDHRQVGKTLDQTGILKDPYEGGMFPVENIVLFCSELKPSGSVYTKVWDVPLGVTS
jgi:2'-5' RNA ligase